MIIFLAVVASVGLIALGVIVGLGAGKTNRSDERPVLLAPKPRTAVLIVLPRVDIRS